MAIFRDEVTILKSNDIGEYDKILVLFGRRHGRFSAIGKGIRRLSSKKSGHLQTFSLCKMSCAEGKSLDIIIEAEEYFTLDARLILASEYERIGFCGFVLNKFLPEGVSDEYLFTLWSEYVKSSHGEEETWRFVLNTLKRQGFISDETESDLERLTEKYPRLKILRSEVEGILNNI